MTDKNGKNKMGDGSKKKGRMPSTASSSSSQLSEGKTEGKQTVSACVFVHNNAKCFRLNLYLEKNENDFCVSMFLLQTT